ncbi:MAG: LAGLIDADG family homing endonuclease [Bacteroidetes bacterium]|nr:LAGLIDADG family homing endonuclease [Gammaproteobacteria bacterium]MBU1820918.1 LAGLIDADG family homing endonuclease [Bacteroidota bacterium]
MDSYNSTLKFSNEEAAYLAGLIDGEGTVTLNQRDKQRQRTIVISIANTERQLLDYAKTVIGVGSISSKRVMNPNHTPSFSYQVSGRQALAVLEQICPYLKSYKKERAELLLKDYIKVTPRNGAYTTEMLELRSEFIKAFFEIQPNKNNPRKQVIFK